MVIGQLRWEKIDLTVFAVRKYLAAVLNKHNSFHTLGVSILYILLGKLLVSKKLSLYQKFFLNIASTLENNVQLKFFLARSPEVTKIVREVG